MQAWIGTSGYSYPDWVGGFYPVGTRPPKMLSFYCRHFPVVELNFTFYRLPAPAMLARLADQTPEGFQFLVKLPRTLSHDESPQDISAFRTAVHELSTRSRLLGLLCQFPQATHDLPVHRSWIERLAHEFNDSGLAVEFRHRSWHHAELAPWLSELKLDLVAVDVPDLPGLFPRGMVKSGKSIYVRFHSRIAKNWYLSDKDRYDFNYDDQALGEWIDALKIFGQDVDKVFLLFNNCQRSQAAANAQRMKELLAARAPEVETVLPFAAAAPRQQLLFE
jgi:uncharacterized protein YecE (DUF72 family)